MVSIYMKNYLYTAAYWLDPLDCWYGGHGSKKHSLALHNVVVALEIMISEESDVMHLTVPHG